MKLKKRDQPASVFSRSETLPECNRESRRLNSNDNNGSTAKFEQKAIIKHEEPQDGATVKGMLDGADTPPDANSNREDNLKQEDLLKPEYILHGSSSNVDTREILEPDVNDPNFYCRSCNHTYPHKHVYRQHLKRFHKMKLRSLNLLNKNPAILPDWNDANFHCNSCNRTYASLPSYHLHCRTIHDLRAPQKPTGVPGVPDIDDPNNHCVKNHLPIQRLHQT
ncbi:C2H2-type zinc finger transcription factor [Mucor lusitanicus CBS 277.49]|uniref:C2H2-type zinc finger transcription factor n=1 Tax=Mucor lusitanicus CBS 277.49 TaxID=747725 RepID=A0A168M021_MUCCL|nr:C2H2-type zinc finger transcription factor [Mucor lusitanicus CBS 277.49]